MSARSCAAAFFANFSLLHTGAAFALRSLCRDDVVDAEEQACRLCGGRCSEVSAPVDQTENLRERERERRDRDSADY